MRTLERFWRETFVRKLEEMENDPKIRLLEQFPQHDGNTTFQHCHNVAVYSYYLEMRLQWEIDAESLVMGAMLHDYYLYDARNSDLSDYQHGISHPKVAVKNASKYFELTPKVENIIRSHMWPLPFSERPRSKEAVLVNMADKYCAYQEMRRGIMRVEDMIPYQRRVLVPGFDQL